MPSILLTAFEPYDRWKTNASWLALVQLTRDLPSSSQLTTRFYPVDFAAVKKRLAEELPANFDYAIHVGQAPGSARIHLEAIAINVGGSPGQSPDQFRPLANDGPVAYRSELPLAEWDRLLRGAAIPSQVSYHAGTYLCNATLYYTHYLAAQLGLKTKAAFVHLPLDVSQIVHEPRGQASLPSEISAAALRLILNSLV